jgi:microcystin-dependent protein
VASPFIAEIRIFSFNFAPRGWAFTNGQLLPINQNQALFSLLGTTYGGNGQTNFALPNLQDRTPVHFGTSVFGSYALGQTGGASTHTLTTTEMPVHAHGIAATTATAPATAIGPENALPASATHEPYRSGMATAVPMKAGLVQNAGNGQPHSNLQPYLAVNICIALQGIFPSRN